ncbi:glycosyltransferase [Streptomyces sp. NPDC046870]|uniref:glycosyltransferase n=1 Tax=Streptomyces sp. NPDC046870 TaxID=3155135 RepID=UPI00345512D5
MTTLPAPATVGGGAAAAAPPVHFYWSGQEFDFGHFLAVASAAAHAPGRVVVIVDEEPAGNRYFELLRSVPRVEIEPLCLEELMSPAHADLYRRMTFVAHRSDLVSFCVLASRGGLYLDTDTLTRRPLGELPDRLLLEDGKIVQVGVLAFPPGDPLPAAMVEDFLHLPEKDLAVYQSIVYRWTRLVRASTAPDDFSPHDRFFPVHWKQWETIFRDDDRPELRDDIHILHHYGYFSRAYTRQMDTAWLRSHPCLFSELALPVVEELENWLGRSLDATAVTP